MKRLFALLLLAAACAAMSGCNEHNMRRNGCDSCGNGHARGLLLRGREGRCRGCGMGGLLAGGLCAGCAKNAGAGGAASEGGGPPMAQYAYPYYTVRGPRDFLVNNPPSIGP